jgi:hypothetical protein
MSDELSDSSKRIRRRMEKIDLSSDSSIELSSESEDEQSQKLQEKLEQESVTSTVEETSFVTSASVDIDNEPKVKIIRVDVIKPADNANPNEVKISEPANNNTEISSESPESSNVEPIVEEVEEKSNDEQKVTTSGTSNKKDRRQSDSNRIVISDSSDDEESSTDNDRNRRFSDGNYTSAYSFADVNGERFESRASFDDDFRRYRYRRRRDEFDENARRTYRNCSENMRRIFQQANIARAQAQAVGDEAMRNLRSSTNFLPDLLSTFQSHFRPLFQAQPPFNGNNFNNFYR